MQDTKNNILVLHTTNNSQKKHFYMSQHCPINVKIDEVYKNAVLDHEDEKFYT